jgi:hypothetical protein
MAEKTPEQAQAEESEKAARDEQARVDKHLAADEFVVVAPYVTLKMKGADGGPPVVRGFNEGAVVKGEDVDEANLRHHVETRLSRRRVPTRRSWPARRVRRSRGSRRTFR